MNPQDPAPQPTQAQQVPLPQAPVAQIPQQETVPSVWPGAFGLYKFSKAAILVNTATLLVLWFSYQILSSLPQAADDADPMIALPIGLVASIASIILYAAFVYASIASVRRQKISIGESLSKIFQPLLLLKLVASGIIAGLLAVGSLFLFIIPFFFVFPRVVLSPYFLIDKNLGPIEAIDASWKATKGHAGKIWGIHLAEFAMLLLCITIIGIPFSIYFLFMYSAALAIVYLFITQQNQNVAAPQTAFPASPAVQPTSPVQQ